MNWCSPEVGWLSHQFMWILSSVHVDLLAPVASAESQVKKDLRKNTKKYKLDEMKKKKKMSDLGGMC